MSKLENNLRIRILPTSVGTVQAISERESKTILVFFLRRNSVSCEESARKQKCQSRSPPKSAIDDDRRRHDDGITIDHRSQCGASTTTTNQFIDDIDHHHRRIFNPQINHKLTIVSKPAFLSRPSSLHPITTKDQRQSISIAALHHPSSTS